MIVGEGRAGKTALANSILGRKYENTESTVGINEFTCNVGYASVGASNADGLWSEHKREVQQKLYEVALAKMVFDKKTGREQLKRGESEIEREEVELELLLWKENQGGYLQGEDVLNKREEGKVMRAEIDKSLVMQYLGEKSCVDSKFLVSVFDFGGQSVFNVIHPFFLTRFGVYLLVFNMEWLSSNASMRVKDDCLSYITFWLTSIIIHTQNEKGEVAPIFIVGTKKDLVSSPVDHLQISMKLYEAFSGSLAWPYVVENVGAEGPDLCFYPINNMLSNHDVAMQTLLKKIEETIDSSSYVHVERPLSWFRVIDALKQANVPYMRYKEAERIITGCDIPQNRVSLLLRFLHEMGILMWHDQDQLREVVVFDPIEYFVKPATIVICKHVPDEADGIYHLLDIHRTARKLHGRDFQRMTRHALLQQHEENYLHISQLMLKYGLLVPLTVEKVENNNEDDNEALYLAPALLPELKRSGDNVGLMFLRLDQIRAVVEKKTTLITNLSGGRSLLNAQEAMKMYDAWLVDYTVFDEYDIFISYRWGKRDSEFTLALFDRMTLFSVGESRRSIQAFLDRKRLRMGENFQTGFVKALLKSLVMVPVVSAEALERMTKMRVEEEDNVLIEWICGLECMKAVEKKGSREVV
eukprot:gene13083-biopygen2861